MSERNAWGGRRLLITGVVLALIPVALMAARGRRIQIDGEDGTWAPSGEQILAVNADGRSTFIDLPLSLRIGNQTFDYLWVNENGFVMLTEDTNMPPPETHIPSAQSLEDLPDNVIAAFYSDVQGRIPEDGCTRPRSGCGADVTTASLDLPEDPDQDPQPAFHRATRVTWGFFGNDQYPAGVAVREGNAVDESKRGSFQIRLIDRSGAPNQAGDFDLELGYNGIPWQNRGIVGVKAGGVLLNFSAFYASFHGENPDTNTLPTDHPCYAASGLNPSFDRQIPFPCNYITVSFRNGVPNLRTYTADVSAANASQTGVTANAGESSSFNVAVANEDYDAATNVTSSMTMPAGWSFVSATPGNICGANGTQLSCIHPSLATDSSVTVGLTFRSTAAGSSSPALIVSADQFDPAQTNNTTTLQASIAATADLTITGCNVPPSTVRGTTATVTCSVRNDGPQEATGVSLSTQLPSSVTFGSGTGCSASGTAVTCTRSSIAAGTTVEFPMTLNAVTSGSGPIAISVTAAQNDPTQPNALSIAVAISEPAPPPPPSSGGGGGGGGSFSLLTLLALGLLRPNRRRIALDRCSV